MTSESRHLTPGWQPRGAGVAPWGARAPESAQPGQHVLCVQPEGLFLQCAAASCPEPLPRGGRRPPRAAAWRFLHASSPVSAVSLLSPSPRSPVPLPLCLLPEMGREGVGATPPPLQPTMRFSFNPWSPGFAADSLQRSRKACAFRLHPCLASWWQVVLARPRPGRSSGPQRADSSIRRKLGGGSTSPLLMAVTGYQGTSSGHLLFVLRSLPACGLTYDLANRHRLSQAGDN